MKSLIERCFSPQDREAIREATARAEARTSGELVCYVVERCDRYPEAALRATLNGALVTTLLAALLHELLGLWGAGLLWIGLPPALGAFLGWTAHRLLPALQRRLIAPEILERRLSRRAAAAFVEEEIFATENRTGVLLFLALFEHRVLILPDVGWRERLPQETWQEISDRLAAGLSQGRATAALLEAIETCGELLTASSPPSVDDINELSDEPRMHHE